MSICRCVIDITVWNSPFASLLGFQTETIIMLVLGGGVERTISFFERMF